MDLTSTARSSATDGATDLGLDAPKREADGRARNALQILYAPICEPLAAVEDRLRRELQSPYESLAPLLRHGTQLGGKRLRPAMLLLAGKASGTVTEEHVVLGTVIEMVHTATLIHDDVIDQAETRRHVPTINAIWNPHTSILTGDYLFAQSFRLAATLDSTEACRQIGEASRLVCEGEMRQVVQRDALDLDETVYLEIIRAKTAELCRVACSLGAHYTGASPEIVSQLSDFGDAVGIAFQIADDYLDLWGDDEAVGKTLGTDIEQGKMTLPLIRLLETSTPAVRSEVTRILTGPSQERLERIRPLLLNSDARAYTLHRAEQFRDQALAALSVLAESDSKRALDAIARFSVDRRF